MNQKKTDILIIGLGLAGMTAAITAAQNGKKVTIITKTKEPKIMLMTSLGRIFDGKRLI